LRAVRKENRPGLEFPSPESDQRTFTENYQERSNLAPLQIESRRPDPALAHLLDGKTALQLDACPWFNFGDLLFLAVARGCNPEPARAAVARNWPGSIVVCDVDRRLVRSSISEVYRNQLIQTATTLCPEDASCRRLGTDRTLPLTRALILITTLFTFAAPMIAITLLIGWITLVNAANILVRLSALFANTEDTFARPSAMPTALPKISILLPLLREERVLEQLLEAVGRLDYPKDRLDVKLILEENDHATRRRLAVAQVPHWVETIIVPEGQPKTKPRAMNYALPFCTGEIVGIYDAEDIPHSDQLRIVVSTLHNSADNVACVQASLDFFNPHDNWLTRCFTLDYALWFRVLLHGVYRLGMPLPLGGTSVFFRKTILEDIGAWDAHNVTEDADLGMRLARRGYRCQMIPSHTLEEANGNAASWVRQRSRWLKGYAITWLTHMRTPRKLWTELGPMGFLGLNILLVGGITSYLAAPIYLMLLAGGLMGLVPTLDTDVQTSIWLAFFITLPLGNMMTLAIAALAVRRRGLPGLYLWLPTLPFYWLMGSVACYRAILELFTNPFHWHKTEHGRARNQSVSSTE
jgi:cellulose synthase/poly-beta-1,6-N-acetylglucosamine synthase-like glycosyltransferase